MNILKCSETFFNCPGAHGQVFTNLSTVTQMSDGKIPSDSIHTWVLMPLYFMAGLKSRKETVFHF